MKISILSAAFLCLLFLSSCDIGPTVNGSGEIITEKREVASFTGIDVEGAVDVDVTYGASQKVELTSDDNIVAIITTEVRSGILHVESKENYSATEGVRLTIVVPVITSIEVQGSSDVTVTGEPIEANRLDEFRVDISGSGDVRVDAMEADKVIVDVNGSGSFDVKDLDADETRIEISGSGDILLKGEGRKLDAEISGSGEIAAFDYVVAEAGVEVNGSGDLMLNVTESLTAKISGSGSVIYAGEPTVDVDVSGSGSVRRR